MTRVQCGFFFSSLFCVCVCVCVGGCGEVRGVGCEEATERGIASSHCSIKSVGNDQD